MTFADIQGFPKNKKDQSIHQIVKEIREQDARIQKNAGRAKTTKSQTKAVEPVNPIDLSVHS